MKNARKRPAAKKPAAKRAYKSKRFYKRPVSFAKKVQSVIKRTAETKSIQFYQDNIPVSDYPTGAWLGSPAQLLTLPLTPDQYITPISQGNSAQQRVGNKIMLTKVALRGMITPRTYQTTNTTESPSNNAPEPFLFKIWIGYQKDTAYNEVSASLPGFFQEGSASVAPSGTLMDVFRKINTDKYRVVATRTFKVGPQSIVTTQNGTVTANNQNYANNDFKFCQQFSIDVTKYCVKVLKYNDTNNQPNTRGLYWWVEALDPTGVSFTAGRFPASLSYELNIEYQDI
uniref:hypothetical protein n=1 Tax=Polynucleobacter sp. TaxID=2029855 RepID=UPI004047FA97